MKVSVVIPVYNGMPFIKDAIASVLDAQDVDLELIVVDDCSKDDTWEYVSQLDDPRVTAVRNEQNLGATGNWNRALELATGDVVKLLCADDEITPHSLETQSAILADPANAGVVLVAGRRRVIGPDGATVIAAHGLGRLRGRVDGSRALHSTVLGGTNVFGEPSSVMFRRDAAVRAGGFRSIYKFLPDLDFYSLLLQHGDVWCQADVTALFRVSVGSGSVGMVKIQAAQMREFIRAVRAEGRIGALVAAIGGVRASANAWGRRVLYWRLAR